jgi:hypothetical protein
MRNVEQTVISQFGNSPTILALIQGMNENISPHADIDNFYDTIFNVTSPDITLYGLQIWSRIVGLSQSFLNSLPDDFSNSDLQSLVLLKALANISISSAPAINQLLQNWLGGDNVRAYVVDTGNMTALYQFEFALTATQLLILETSGIFLRPSGVLINVVELVGPYVGFAGQEPFVTTMGNGIFFEGV